MERNLSVLVVEDETLLRRLMAHTLQNLGAHVVTAFDGAHAREILARQHGFDLVICDVLMPRVSGDELIEDFHAQGMRAPLILVSARAEALHRADTAARERGLNVLAAVGKPITGNELHGLFARFLASLAPAAIPKLAVGAR